MNTKESINRQPILDYIKAICIIFVIINHCEVIPTSDPFYLFLFRMAVPFFILISGYTFSLSYKSKTILQMYSPDNLLRKFLRYTIPAIITFFIYIFLLLLAGRTLSIKGCISYFLLGSYGLGAFYYDILIQFIIIFPLIYITVTKWDVQGVTIIAFINLFYELFYDVYCQDSSLYRILIFRYLFLISLGIYLYHHCNDKINTYHLIQMICIGIVYLLLPSYFGYSYHIFCNWSDTSMMVGFYAFPVLYFVITNAKSLRISGFFGSLLSLTGQASYHIMFTQMIFFTVRNTIYRFINIKQYGELSEILFAVFSSVTVGIIFYKLDNKCLNHLYYKKI